MQIWITVTAGEGKGCCEDAAVFGTQVIREASLALQSGGLLRVAVADGVGGNAGGEAASRYVAEALSDADFSQWTATGIRQFMQELNAGLLQYAQNFPEARNMATTLTGIVAGNDGYYLIHAGNCRLYVMQGRYLKQLTTDHTAYQWLLRHGQTDQAAQCNQNQILCCLGSGDPRQAGQLTVKRIFEQALPETLVLTSDGIHDYVDIDFMEEALANAPSPAQAAKIIAEKARENGSRDDQSLIILRR